MKSTIQDYFLFSSLLGTEEGKHKWPHRGLKLNQRKNFSSFGVMNDRSRALRRAVESVSRLRWNASGDAGGWECHVQRWPSSCQTLSCLVAAPSVAFSASVVSFKPSCVSFLVPSFHRVAFLLTVLPDLLVPYSIVSNSSLWLSALHNVLLLFIIFYFHK